MTSDANKAGRLRSLLRKALSCVREGRLPYFIEEGEIAYRWALKLDTYAFKLASLIRAKPRRMKCLYCTFMDATGKRYLRRVLEQFGCDDFDYVVFVYDDAQFDEEIFKPCRIVREKGGKWGFIKKYITPAVVRNYSHIFLWDDDVELVEFSARQFIRAMVRNNLEMAQPSLSPDSHVALQITAHDHRYRVGRYTDFVEVMCPVFSNGGFLKFWRMVEGDSNFWGWGYDLLARSVGGIRTQGIIDSQIVKHVRPLRTQQVPSIMEDYRIFMAKHRDAEQTRFVTYGRLR